jgi:hypothetical protein
MNNGNIKAELKELIEKETDTRVLEAIKVLLEKAGLNQVLKEKLTARALKAEEDISAKRLMNRKELETRLNEKLNI